MQSPDFISQEASRLVADIFRALGFECHVETVSCTQEEINLAVTGRDAHFIIGEDGSRLDDLQYLINRLIVVSCPDAPRIRVDCDHYRERTEKRIIQDAVQKAEQVLSTGHAVTIGPLNAYHRRLVHSAIAEMSGVETVSENVDSRFKRITIAPSA